VVKKAVWLLFTIVVVSAGAGVSILLFGIQDLAIYTPVAIVGITVFVMAMLRPFLGYLLFSMVLPLQSEEFALVEIGGSVIRIADVIALPVFLGWLLSACFINREGLPFRKTGLELPLFTFSFFVVLSAIWSASVTTSISKILQLIYGIILFYMTVDLIRTRKYLVHVLWAWIIGGLFLTGTTIYDALTSVKRATSPLTANSLVTAEYLNYPLFLGMALILTTRSLRAKALVSMITAFCVFALIATQARGPMLGFGAALLFLVIALPDLRRLLRWIPTAATVALAVAIVWSVALNFSLIEFGQDSMIRFIHLIEEPTSDVGVWFRLTLWLAAWKLYLQNPIIGIGVGSLSERISPYTPVEFGDTEVLHNLYLEMLLLFGFLGFIVFLLLFFQMAKLIWRMWQETDDHFFRTLMTGVIAAIIAQAVGWITYGKVIENRVFWVCLALSFAISRVYRKEAKMPAPFCTEQNGFPLTVK
jgi:putative inorganic carbon (HCO3(-)) transporter